MQFPKDADSDGFAHGLEDFDGVALTAVAREMMVNELDDVAALEPVSGTSQVRTAYLCGSNFTSKD